MAVQAETWTLDDVFVGGHSMTGIAAHCDKIAVIDWNDLQINAEVKIFNSQGAIGSPIPIQAESIAAIPNQWVIVQRKKVSVYNQSNNTQAKQFPVGESETLQSVAFMNNGNILIGDTQGKKLFECNPTNEELIRTLPVGIAPWYLAVMDNDNIVITGWKDARVVIADGNGVTLHNIIPQIGGQPVVSCRGVCSDHSSIYVVIKMTQDNTGHIHHYDIEGNFISCVAQGLYKPRGITFTSDGKLAVADTNTVKVYTRV